MNELNISDIRKAVASLRGADIYPKAKGPTKWWIDEGEDGWTIKFSGPVSGFVHPRSFCEMIIKGLNGD